MQSWTAVAEADDLPAQVRLPWSLAAHAPDASHPAASRLTLPCDAPVTAGRRYGTA